MRILNKVLTGIDKFNHVTGKWFALLVIPCTLVIFYEVVMRYVFNSPTIWAHETSNYFFGALFVLGGAHTLLHKGHVNVEILHVRFPLKVRAVIDIITSGVFFIMMGVIFWYGFLLAKLSVESLEISHTVWGPPVYPIKIMVPIASLFIMAQGLARLVRDIETLVTGKEVTSSVAQKEVVYE